MMALVRKVTKEIECFFPVLDRALHGGLRKLLYYGEHTLNDSVLIAEYLGGLLEVVMPTTHWLDFTTNVSASRLIHLYWTFHSYFSFPEKIRRLGLALSRIHAR